MWYNGIIRKCSGHDRYDPRSERKSITKTVEEFIKEIGNSEALRNEIGAIGNDDELAAFLKKNDCGASVNEYMEYVLSLSEGELSDDDAEAAAGGQRNPARNRSPYAPPYRLPIKSIR